jgi:DNA-binding beta-propeller fold protein YncE
LAVAVAPNGNVYDASPLEGITYYTYTGALLGRWNSEKDEVHNLERPREIAIGPDGTVFVADYMWDWQYSRIKYFTLTGELLGELSLEGIARPGAIGGLAVGPDGTVYVTVTNNHRIHYFRRVDKSE